MPKVPYRFLSSRSLPVKQVRECLVKYLQQNAPCVFVPNYDYVASSVSHELPKDVGVLGVLHSDDDEHYVHGYQMGHYWDAIVTVSDTIQEKFLKLNPVFAERTQTIRYGIPTSPYEPVKIQSSDRIRLIYTGRIIQKQKRIFDCLSLMEKLHTRNVPFEMTFVGSGVDGDAFQLKLKPWLERGIARYLGSCSSEQVVAELKSHDALVLTSEFEGLPLSLLEAMAQKCVPVVTDVPSGIGEILKHRENAMISPVGDIDRMVKNIMSLHYDRSLMETISEHAYRTLFDFELTAPQMADKYQTILLEIFQKISCPNTKNAVALNNAFVRRALNVA